MSGTTSQLFSASTDTETLDWVIETESAASTPSGSTVYFEIEDIENNSGIPDELQELITEARDQGCGTMELYT
jgi:hypothetical protein